MKSGMSGVVWERDEVVVVRCVVTQLSWTMAEETTQGEMWKN